jgi:hypothetical protein
VSCEACEAFIHEHYINYEKHETLICPICKNPTLYPVSSNAKKAILPGQFANSPDEELYIRPDKDNPAREWMWTARRIEQMETAGETPKVDDTASIRKSIRYHQSKGFEL